MNALVLQAPPSKFLNPLSKCHVRLPAERILSVPVASNAFSLSVSLSSSAFAGVNIPARCSIISSSTHLISNSSTSPSVRSLKLSDFCSSILFINSRTIPVSEPSFLNDISSHSSRKGSHNNIGLVGEPLAPKTTRQYSERLTLFQPSFLSRKLTWLNPIRCSHHNNPSLSSMAAMPSVSTINELPSAAATATTQDASTGGSQTEVLVQYIVVRKDLMDTMKWPLGSVISQGCHAAVAAIWLHKEDPDTAQYCGLENLDNMHKVTLEVKGETQLRNLAQKLENDGVAYKLWIEQPENIPTCLATKPYRKSVVASFFKSLKLCK